MMWSGREIFNQLSTTIFKLPEAATEQERVRGQFKSFNYMSHMVIYGGSHDDANNIRSIVTTYNLMKRFTSPNTTNATEVMNSLCDTDSQCATVAINCPNACSGHGGCSLSKDLINTCYCDEGWSGLDCSIGDFTYQVHTFNSSYTGSMIGREAAVLKFAFNPMSSLLGLDLVLTTTSPTGVPFMFLNVTSKASALTGSLIKHIARQQVEYHVLNGLNGYFLSSQLHGQLSGGYFQYYNVSHDRIKVTLIHLSIEC